MARAPARTAPSFAQTLRETFLVNERMNQIILEHLDPRAWRAEPPGRGARTIAAIFVHVHNIRRKWLRLSAPHIKLPAQLDRSLCTREQARAALRQSARHCSEMIAEAFAIEGRVKQFHRDGWARPWPVGPSMVAYMIVHEAHHRGQVCMLAHQLGYALPAKLTSEMWSWERLWKECGFTLSY